MDPGQNNADGFAAKITVAQGNIFRGCVAYNNLDDGWDLFAKIESGPIGAVLIENSIAYNNGTLTDGVGNGDGNGFKLGGDGIAVAHILRNSISYNNNTNGVTSNSNPSVVVENVTSYGNKGKNVSLYGKGSGERNFVMTGMLSMAGTSADDISEMPTLASESNYFSYGNEARNSVNESVNQDIFVSTDLSIQPGRSEDGSIDMKGLFEIKADVFNQAGAKLTATPVTLPNFMEEEEIGNGVIPSIPSEPSAPSEPSTPSELPVPGKDEEGIEKEKELPQQILERVNGHWVEAAYRNLFALGITKEEDVIDLDDKISRQNVLSYLIRAMKPDLSEKVNPLAIAVQEGWIRGFGNGQYGMDQILTREQGMVIMARILRQNQDRTLNPVDVTKYQDWKQVSDWAKEDVLYVIQAGIVKGKSASILDPKAELTFAEILVLIHRLME